MFPTWAECPFTCISWKYLIAIYLTIEFFDCQRYTDRLKDELQNYAKNGPHISGKKFNLDGLYWKKKLDKWSCICSKNCIKPLSAKIKLDCIYCLYVRENKSQCVLPINTWAYNSTSWYVVNEECKTLDSNVFQTCWEKIIEKIRTLRVSYFE